MLRHSQHQLKSRSAFWHSCSLRQLSLSPPSLCCASSDTASWVCLHAHYATNDDMCCLYVTARISSSISVHCRVEKQQGQGREAITKGGLCVPDQVKADPVPGGHGSGAGPKHQSHRYRMEESPAHAPSLACSLLCESIYLDCHSQIQANIRICQRVCEDDLVEPPIISLATVVSVNVLALHEESLMLTDYSQLS